MTIVVTIYLNIYIHTLLRTYIIIYLNYQEKNKKRERGGRLLGSAKQQQNNSQQIKTIIKTCIIFFTSICDIHTLLYQATTYTYICYSILLANYTYYK